LKFVNYKIAALEPDVVVKKKNAKGWVTWNIGNRVAEDIKKEYHRREKMKEMGEGKKRGFWDY